VPLVPGPGLPVEGQECPRGGPELKRPGPGRGATPTDSGNRRSSAGPTVGRRAGTRSGTPGPLAIEGLRTLPRAPMIPMCARKCLRMLAMQDRVEAAIRPLAGGRA
jgi:hypothetical protein